MISDQGGAKSGALEAEPAKAEPRLKLVIQSWETLPEAIKAGILAMVEAARAEQ